MEYLYHINPILRQEQPIIIYGIGEEERSIFSALLQQNIYVTAFSLKEGEESNIKKIFNKRVISFQELKKDFLNAYVVIVGTHASSSIKVLQNEGIENIVIENITLKDKRIVFLGDWR